MKYLIIDGQQRIRSLYNALGRESEHSIQDSSDDDAGDVGNIEPRVQRIWCLNLSRVPGLKEFFDTGMSRFGMFHFVADPRVESARVKYNLIPLPVFFEGQDADVLALIRPTSATPEQVLERMKGISLGDGVRSLLERKVFSPGHCPDAIAFQVGKEALIVGDNLLPQITPHPTQEAYYRWTGKILPAECDRPEKIYGLRAYLRSLKRLEALGRAFPEMIVLPAHRLFYANRWHMIELENRSAEIIEHHVHGRCASVLGILNDGPQTLEHIVLAQFEPSLLKGLGFKLAENEVRSHLELLEHSGDVEWSREDRVKRGHSDRHPRRRRQRDFPPFRHASVPHPDATRFAVTALERSGYRTILPLRGSGATDTEA